jgi:hypothetical protein
MMPACFPRGPLSVRGYSRSPVVTAAVRAFWYVERPALWKINSLTVKKMTVVLAAVCSLSTGIVDRR